MAAAREATARTADAKGFSVAAAVAVIGAGITLRAR